MTSLTPVDFNWRAEQADLLAEECRQAFEEQVNYAAIAKAWCDEAIDTHPQAAGARTILECAFLLSLERLYDTDAVAKLGATLDACLAEDAFNDEWYAKRREAQRCADYERGYAG